MDFLPRFLQTAALLRSAIPLVSLPLLNPSGGPAVIDPPGAIGLEPRRGSGIVNGT
jgi:hypothetical protein